MHRIPIAAALLAALVCLPAHSGAIRLKSRSIDGLRSPGAVTGAEANIPHAGHWIVQFARYPDLDTRKELTKRGGRILDYVPDAALMVNFRMPASLQGLGVVWLGQLAPADKLGAGLDRARTYLVIFHHDISPARIKQLLRDYPTLPSNGLLPGQNLLDADSGALAHLTQLDEVAYVIPGTADMTVRKRAYRCGGPLTEAGPVAEYALMGNGWSKDANGNVIIGYFFDALTEKLDPNVVRTQIVQAFGEWQRYANIELQPAQAEAAARSIDVLFARRAHGDDYPFDGPGGVLAHTFYPAPLNPDPLAGDMHFDDDENWEVGPGAGVDLYSVALHEAGHALGLAHSTDATAVMYPYYQLATGLSSDDIAAIQALYGPPSSSTPAPTPPTPTPPTPTPPAPTPPTSPGSGSGTSTDTTPPSLAICVPSATIVTTQASSLALSGAASDNVGVTSVKWSTSNGDSGTATGTAAWSATVPVYQGTNVITVRAYDAAGNTSWRAVTVVRQ